MAGRKKKRKSKKDKQEEAPQRPKCLMLYLGLAEISRDRMRHVYLPVSEDWQKQQYTEERPNLFGPETRFYQKRFGWSRPGTAIEIEYDAEKPGTVYHHTARRVGSLKDSIAGPWQAASDAVKTAHDAKVQARKEGARDLQMEMLEPLRKVYHSLRNRHQRAAFLARVQLYLMG
jgi:hypothetical protein